MTNHETYWHMQEQTRAKHAIFERYLREWAVILGKYTPLLQYVDTHAGKGKYEGGEPGSPIIAMKLGQEIHNFLLGRNIMCRLNCQYVESKQEYHASLVAELKAIEQQNPAVSWASYQGTFQEHTSEVLAQIPPGSSAFIFVDPFGYNDVEMELLLPFLTRGKKHELFITFMVENINRFISDPHKHPAADRVFGTPAWREVTKLQDGRERSLVMLYAKELQRQASRGRLKITLT
jgi:three-Cys-motif partner protein